MIKSLNISIRKFFNLRPSWKQVQAEVYENLGINQSQIFTWKPHRIIQINSEKNIVTLETKEGKHILIESDKITTQKLTQGINANKFLRKYGTEFIHEIKHWNFSYSRIKPPEFYIDLRTRLKLKDQTTEKRRKMYHKRKIVVSEYFIKKLIEKTF
ncbi:hypothetical protein [Gaetbulibacter sp. PBL-D1]|uniref:hypothetical protein n=1 Tax=Gaetbulibacter sp. PBL-D1 TaxID=3422594 RepID=UPI003D2EF570